MQTCTEGEHTCTKREHICTVFSLNQDKAAHMCSLLTGHTPYRGAHLHVYRAHLHGKGAYLHGRGAPLHGERANEQAKGAHLLKNPMFFFIKRAHLHKAGRWIPNY